jgi:hypothetical protein
MKKTICDTGAQDFHANAHAQTQVATVVQSLNSRSSSSAATNSVIVGRKVADST